MPLRHEGQREQSRTITRRNRKWYYSGNTQDWTRWLGNHRETKNNVNYITIEQARDKWCTLGLIVFCMARFTPPKTKHMQTSENVAQRHFCVDDGGGGGGLHLDGWKKKRNKRFVITPSLRTCCDFIWKHFDLLMSYCSFTNDPKCIISWGVME